MIVQASVTYTDLTAMFPGDVGDQATVEAGLPSLNTEMVAASISAAPRQAPRDARQLLQAAERSS